FSPAYTSFQTISFSPAYAFSTAASNTLCAAAQISGPVPSPSINGIIGLFGVFNTPFSTIIFSPCVILFPPVLVMIYYNIRKTINILSSLPLNADQQVRIDAKMVLYILRVDESICCYHIVLEYVQAIQIPWKQQR